MLERENNEIWHSPMTKTLNQQKIHQPIDNTKTSLKLPLQRRLRTDKGRSVGVTTVIQLVWLNRFKGTQT